MMFSGVLIVVVLALSSEYGCSFSINGRGSRIMKLQPAVQISKPANSRSTVNIAPRISYSSATSTRNSRWVRMSVIENEVKENNVNKDSPLPQHRNMRQGKLDNGFTYIILPNSNPPGRFEAHLEVLSGSANELESQQGMAHLLEHVSYMGSPKRQLISGTGSRTNAYTDFHHTVFFAACPTQTPEQFWKKPMLPMALDALLDVMTTTIDDDRLEKERAAVLSEASMVNKMEYRVECQILSSLHSENRISRRFPIGKEELIKAWKKEDLQLYHNTHYRPDNVILFVVGDVDVDSTIETINDKFGHLKPKLDAPKLLRESGEFPLVSMEAVSRHFPPVIHRWSCTDEEVAACKVPSDLVRPKELFIEATTTTASLEAAKPKAVKKDKEPPQQQKQGEAVAAVAETTQSATTAAATTTTLAKKAKDLKSAQLPVSRVFKHELLQSFSFHLFAKRPIEPITTKRALKRDLLRRITLSALQIRLNVQQRQDPLCTFIDYNQLNWPREGCAVCSLDLTTDIGTWRQAVKMAVREIRRLGLYGLTENELMRYKQAIIAEASQTAAQGDQIGNEDVLSELMEAEACGHTFMHPDERRALTEAVLNDVTLEDANAIARELCEHLSHIEPAQNVRPAAVIACSPILDRNGAPFAVSEEEINDAVEEAIAEPLEPLENSVVPDTLITKEQLQAKVKQQSPRWVPLTGKAAAAVAGEGSNNKKGGNNAKKAESSTNPMGIVQKQLSNGMKVNLFSHQGEPQRGNMRIYVPGGRMLESKGKPGDVLVGSRTVQEGGAFLSMTREDVELFCIDHLVMVDIITTEEALIFDFQTVTTPGPGGKVTGLEAVMQVAHIIMTDFKYEEDAFERARLSFHEQYDSICKGLESACQECLVISLLDGDSRFLAPNHAQLDALDLNAVKTAMLTQLNPATIEVSISADAPMDNLEALALYYLGTVPSKTTQLAPGSTPSSGSTKNKNSETETESDSAEERAVNWENASKIIEALPEQAVTVRTLGKKEQLGVYLADSDERAMGYLAGPAPNSWGVFANGDTVAGFIKQKTAAGGKKDDRRDHPLFGSVSLLILQEVVNRRLFSVVREERQLTYDASFQLQGYETMRGGWYLVSVTSSPTQVQEAIRACKEALGSLKGQFGVMGDSVQSAKRTILNRFRSGSVTNKFWVDNMSGTQLECIPKKDLRCISEFETVLNGITVQDVQLLVESFQIQEENITVCVGVTGPQPPAGMQKQPKQQQQQGQPSIAPSSSAKSP